MNCAFMVVANKRQKKRTEMWKYFFILLWFSAVVTCFLVIELDYNEATEIGRAHV